MMLVFIIKSKNHIGELKLQKALQMSLYFYEIDKHLRTNVHCKYFNVCFLLSAFIAIRQQGKA